MTLDGPSPGGGPPGEPCGGVVKRVFDVVVATTLLVLLAPIIVGVALLIRLRLGSPVLFRQIRPGYLGKPFAILKFRTMSDARDANGTLLPNEQRRTRFGDLLRQTSIDELPELINVIRGEMSLVGPRPLLMEYLPLYTKEQNRRHDARPGITGWAQVNGRNVIGWEERFALDTWYVGHWNLFLDLKILGQTAARVLGREDVRPEGEFTMARFTGASAELHHTDAREDANL